MTANTFNISTPVRVGSLVSDPASPTNGLLYYNTTLGLLRVYLNGVWNSLSTGGSAAWVTKTTTYTASVGDLLIADTTSAGFTITLPASPSIGNTVEITDGGGVWTTNNLTVAGNGANILGSASNFIANVNNATLTFLYYNSPRGWLVIQG